MFVYIKSVWEKVKEQSNGGEIKSKHSNRISITKKNRKILNEVIFNEKNKK